MGGKYSPLAMVGIILLSTFVGLTVHASDSQISSNTTWNGHTTLTGNVTIASGSILTISSGSIVDGTDGHWIKVEGELIATDTTFFSSATPASQTSHGAGLWQGIIVSPGGKITVNNCTISNSNVGIKSEGEIYAENLVINDSYLGIKNIGMAEIENLYTEYIDYESIDSTGTLTISDSEFSNTATGLKTGLHTEINNVSFTNSGVGIDSNYGILNGQLIQFSNTSVGIASQSGAAVSLTQITGENVSLLADAGDSDALLIDNVSVTGERLLAANSATSYHLTNVLFDQITHVNSPVIESRCEGQCSISNVNIANSHKAVSLSGSGTHQLSNTTINSTYYSVQAVGDGVVVFANMNAFTTNLGLSLRGPDSFMTGHSHVSGTSTVDTLIEVLDGTHDWQEVTINKPYSNLDTTSIGLDIWYTDLNVDTLSVENCSSGLILQDSGILASEISVIGGIYQAVNLKSSEIEVDDFTTKYQTYGIQATKQSQIVIDEWNAELHYTPLDLYNQSNAYVRFFQPLNTNPSSDDAAGNGNMVYGGSTNARISTTTSSYLEETIVRFTDITGNGVEAIINLYAFELTTDENGYISLPLNSAGTEATITVLGAGLVATLYGGVSSQVIQVPVIPNGDWTIGQGQSITLGPTPDGQPHFVLGNLLVEGNGQLILTNTELMVAEGKTVQIVGNGQILGDNSTIYSPSISLADDALLQSNSLDQSISIDSPVSWSCNGHKSTQGLVFYQLLSISQNCNLSIIEGSILGPTTVSQTSSIELITSLTVDVADRGLPVQGAIITVDGLNHITDNDGQISITTTGRYINQTNDSNGGIKNVYLSLDGFNDLISWDSSVSLEHTFVASRLSSQDFTASSLNLESIWSPYFIENDFTVPFLKTLYIDDGVSIRIADGAKLVVNGTLYAGETTFSSTGFGARWGGIILGDYLGASIELKNSAVLEVVTGVLISGKGLFTADNTVFSRTILSEPLFKVGAGSQAIVEIHNSQFSDAGSGCIEAFQSQSEIIISNTEFDRCDGPAIWARQTNLQLDNITIGSQTSTGLDLIQPNGYLNGLNALSFDGEGNIIRIDNENGQFSISNVVGKTGQSAGISGQNNRALNLDSIEIHGSPAIDFDESAGTLSNLRLYGSGSGTALISHHGRNSDSLEIDNLIIENYSVGVDLHADSPDSVAQLIISHANISAQTAISCEQYPLYVKDSKLTGQVESSGDLVMSFYDTSFMSSEPIYVTQGASYAIYNSVILTSTISTSSVESVYDINTSYSNQEQFNQQAEGESVVVPLLVETRNSNGEMVYLTALTITSNSQFGLPLQQNFDSSSSWESYQQIDFILTENAAPQITLLSPIQNDIIMQSMELTISISAQDDYDSINSLTYDWEILDNNGFTIVQHTNNQPFYNLTFISPGDHVLKISVTDSQGKVAQITEQLEVKLLDSDFDYTERCDENNWFDVSISRSCGPDVYDDDDDNDGYIDSRDAWPTDPCAWQDTDDDGQPDDITCPEGVNTTLFADQDDDGDGIPDELEGKDSAGDSDFDLITLILIIVILVAVGAYVMRIRKQA